MNALSMPAAVPVRIDELVKHPQNPRRGDVARIRELIRENGWVGHVYRQASSGYVISGWHSSQAALAEGYVELPTVTLDVDDAAALRLLVSLNRAHELGHSDVDDVREVLRILEEQGELAGVGYNDRELAALFADATPVQLTDPDDVPAKPEAPVSKPGDLWLLDGGRHRLLCGSATDKEAVARLVAGEVVDAVWTDPPYGVDYEGKTKDKLRIANDAMSAEVLQRELLEPAFRRMREVLRPGGAFYVCGPSGPLEFNFRAALADAGLHMRLSIVWVKDRFVLGHQDLHQRHESVLFGWQLDGEPQVPPLYDPAHETMLYGWKDGASHEWNGGRKQDTVWEIPRPSASKIHPTMKPVQLVTRAVVNSTSPGALVADLFAGSGSLLITAYATSRRSLSMELDPHYVDVILRRWEEHTGDVPVLEATGQAVSFAA